MYRLWKILLSNMSRPETYGMTLVDCFNTLHKAHTNTQAYKYQKIRNLTTGKWHTDQKDLAMKIHYIS